MIWHLNYDRSTAFARYSCLPDAISWIGALGCNPFVPVFLTRISLALLQQIKQKKTEASKNKTKKDHLPS